MIVKYNSYNLVEPSKIYLTVGEKIICALNGIDEESCSLKLNLNNCCELSFSVYKEINGEKTNGYDKISVFKLLYVENIGYFKLTTEPTVTFDGYKEVKQIQAESVECELSGFDLKDFNVNLGTAGSMEMLAKNNVDSTTGIPKENVKFYNKNNKELSLLDLVINQIPWWNIGYVSAGLYNKIAYFEVDNQDIYSFLTQNVAQAYECIVTFDIMNYKINFYDIKTLGKDTNLYIGYRNVQNEIDISCDQNSIYTVLNVSGGDNLDLNFVNYGISTIENLEPYLTSDYMNNDTISHYRQWKVAYDSNRAAYVEVTKKYNKQLDVISDLYDRLPNDGCDTNWNDWDNDDLEKAYSDYVAQKTGYEALYVNSKNEFDINVLKKYPSEYADYISIKNYIIPNINKVLKKTSTNNTVDLDESYKEDWDLYGLNELKSKLQVYQNTANTLYKQGFHGSWSSSSSYPEQYFNDMVKQYNTANSNYSACKNVIKQRQDSIDSANTTLNSYKSTRNDYMKKAQKSTYMSAEEINEISRFYNETDYTNENILTTDIMTTDQVIDTENLLYNDAVEQLEHLSQPQYSYETTVENLLALADYKEEIKDFNLGDYIYIEVDDEKYVKLRAIGIEYNPLLMDNKLSIEFSNMLQYKSKRNDFVDLLNRNVGTSKNSISYGSGVASNSDNQSSISIQLLQKIVNSDYLGSKLKCINADSVNASSLYCDSVVTNYLRTDELEVKIANIKELDADCAFVKYLDTKYLVAEEAVIEKLSSQYATIEDLNATNEKVSELQAKEIDVDSLKATFATLDLANIKEGCITSAMIGDEQVIDSKIVGVSANKLTAGTIDAANIDVVNLNANNLTVGKINGKQIDKNTIDLDNLSEGVSESITDASTNATTAKQMVSSLQQRADNGEFNAVDYDVEIHSSNGNIFKNGEIQTVLSCHVYKNREEITDSINAAKFKWIKKDKNGNEDTDWNDAHAGGVKEITITNDNVFCRATFECYVDLD